LVARAGDRALDATKAGSVFLWTQQQRAGQQ